ncbi:O-antigen ligase family protein [Ornithinicoccus halotolerans]|uniref:O-antigen ligase family protein n=1 Tax=Ornithinicoccus halotolerans TaxID=1748220 RepID=UPI001296656F|nr:O-antigen ligase family protein [Ornithinicoccus halotolerans]
MTLATDGRHALPAWPLAATVGLYPLWWGLGVADVIWIAMGAVMALYLGRAGRVEVPRGFGLWLVFIVWMTLSASQLDTLGRFVGFGYRAMHYYAATALFIYVYNARAQLTERVVAGILTVFWGVTTVGGFLGMMMQEAVVRTPLSYVLPGALVNNELVNHMVVRRFAQYNPDGWVQIDPRPSAPFLYTNNWGNAYSFLLPFVFLYLWHVRRERRFWWIAAMVPVSLIPAQATSNRGMFLALGVIAIYLGLRYLLLGNPRILVIVVGLGAIAAVSVTQLDLTEDIESRTSGSDTTEDRLTIYRQTLVSVQESPTFGMGAPRPSADPSIPPVGTHGQFWIVIHSHGVPAVVAFMGWFLIAYARSLRRRDHGGIIAGAVLVAGMLEAFYYGFLPVGLHLLMVAAAVAMAGPVDAAPPRHSGTGAHGTVETVPARGPRTPARLL